MAIVEYEGKKYDTGFEFDTVRENASSIKWRCFHYKNKLNLTNEEKEELSSISKRMAKIGQDFAMVNDLPRIFQTQKELQNLSAELTQKYDGR